MIFMDERRTKEKWLRLPTRWIVKLMKRGENKWKTKPDSKSDHKEWIMGIEHCAKNQFDLLSFTRHWMDSFIWPQLFTGLFQMHLDMEEYFCSLFWRAPLIPAINYQIARLWNTILLFGFLLNRLGHIKSFKYHIAKGL